MNKLILEDGFPPRRHWLHLRNLIDTTNGTLRVASAYVTDRNLLVRATDRERKLLINLSAEDIVSGATKIEPLGALIDSGTECRYLRGRPSIHAKVYIFGSSCAVITSANLTQKALNSNIEAGVEVDEDDTKDLINWFDKLWDIAEPLDPKNLPEWIRQAESHRHEYEKFKRKMRTQKPIDPKRGNQSEMADSLQTLFSNARHFFVCNSNRRDGERTDTGGFKLEQEMFNRGVAAVWEAFKFPKHIEQVESNDAIFMYAKAVGIVGVGMATGRAERLNPGDRRRINNSNTLDDFEWQVPVHWLDWKDDAEACPWKAQNFSFWNVTGPKSDYEKLRENVKEHFLGTD